MKNRGLKNRFPDSVRLEWLYWYECMVCGRNQQDVLHHIVPPSVRHYVDGEHNRSVLNSCPIHNYPCHVGNEAYLYRDETLKELLGKTLDGLLQMGYCIKQIDRDFMEKYAHLYDPKYLKMVK